MTELELAFKPAHELVKLIRAKKVSPVEAVEVALKRIQKLNPKLNAFLYVAEKEAREQAKLAEEKVMKGGRLPPLHGVPISIKDLNRTKCMPTTFGSLVYKIWIPLTRQARGA